MNYKDFFSSKKIAVVGLGPHGEMLADIKFLLKLGASINLYDMRSEARLRGFLVTLEESIPIENFPVYTFGKISGEDLAQADLIILSPEVSKKSFFLKQATKAGVQIYYPEMLFFKLAPAIVLIGVMGVSGKSTVAQLLYSMLKQSFSDYENQGLYFIDPDMPYGALTHLKKIKAGDVILSRITQEMMVEYHTARVSPHVAIFTTEVPFDIVEYQTYNNFIVAPDAVIDGMRLHENLGSKAKMLRTKNENTALAIQAAELFKVSPDVSQKVIDEFSGLKGRMELVKKVGGIEYYNDSASVHPLATFTALMKLSVNKNIILIIGGAYTGYDYSSLVRNISLYAHTVVLLPGSGSIGFRSELEALQGVCFLQAPNLEEAVVLAHDYAKKGDRVLFSPGCEAIGMHVSRKDRGEKFVKAVRAL